MFLKLVHYSLSVGYLSVLIYTLYLLLTFPEIEFHEARDEELQGNSAESKKGFEEILLYEGLDAKTGALVSKQLEWLQETVEEFGT